MRTFCLLSLLAAAVFFGVLCIHLACQGLIIVSAISALMGLAMGFIALSVSKA